MNIKRIVGCIRIALLLISSSLLFGEAVYEGSIAVGTYGRLPSSGLYGASNAFPKNSTVRVSDSSTGKSVDVLIVEGLENPNIFLLLSPEAAERIALYPNKVMRARAAQVPAGDPVSESVIGEGFSNPDPDINPSASIPGKSEQEMIEAFIQEELAAYDSEDSAAQVETIDRVEESEEPPLLTELNGPRTPIEEIGEPSTEAGMPGPELADKEPELAVKEPELAVKEEEKGEDGDGEGDETVAVEIQAPDIPVAIALERRSASQREDWHGAESPLLPELPQKEIGQERKRPALPEVNAIDYIARTESDEALWSALAEPVLPEKEQELAVGDVQEDAEKRVTDPARVYASPVRRVESETGSGWDRVALPHLPQAEGDPLLANLVPQRALPRYQVADLPRIPEEAMEDNDIRLASQKRREAPDSALSSLAQLPEPAIRDPLDLEKGDAPLLASGDGPREPSVKEKAVSPADPVPRKPQRSVGPIMVDIDDRTAPEGEDQLAEVDAVPETIRPEIDTLADPADEVAEKLIPDDGELVLESAKPRPPEAEEIELAEGEPDEETPVEETPVEETLVKDSPAEEAPSTLQPVWDRQESLKPYLVKSLEKSSWYLQLATFREAGAAGDLAKTLSATYPVTIHPKEDGSSFRVMVGPLRKDESGALLISFRAGGYRDAFLRKGN